MVGPCCERHRFSNTLVHCKKCPDPAQGNVEARETQGFKPFEAWSVDVETALLLTAFHEVLQPILEARCEVNDKTNQHHWSITDRERFVSDNIKYATMIFHKVVGNPFSVGNWFVLHHVRAVIVEMLVEAAKQRWGRWQWRGLWFDESEITSLTHLILRAYVAGASWDD